MSGLVDQRPKKVGYFSLIGWKPENQLERERERERERDQAWRVGGNGEVVKLEVDWEREIELGLVYE